MKNSSQEYNILLTSTGRRTYMIDYFKDSLKGIGKVFASNSEYTYSLSHADGYVLTPLIYDSNYISFLLDFCLKNKIKAIISLFDIDLYILSVNKELFEKEGIILVVSNPETIMICNDKWKTYTFLLENNIPCPKTYKNLNLLINDINNKIISYPIIIKPRWGMGSIGIQIAEDEKELFILYSKVKKLIFNSYLKYESSQDIDECIIFQEKVFGQECGLDVLNDFSSKMVSVVAKEKIEMRAGETNIARTIDSEPFVDIASKLSKNLKHIGNLDVDIYKLKDGSLSVLELNCRFGGQYPFSHLAGVNYPKQIIQWLLGNKTDNSLLNAKIGIKVSKDITPVIISN